MNKSIKSLAFKLESQQVLRVLKTSVDVVNLINQKRARFTAIWDTGATHSVITHRVAQLLELKPTGMTNVTGVNSQGKLPTYLVNLILPMNVMMPNVNVTGAQLGDDIDLLIGMDIISLGDLTISNYGKTTFCYSLPPHDKHIDLYERAEKLNARNKARTK